MEIIAALAIVALVFMVMGSRGANRNARGFSKTNRPPKKRVGSTITGRAFVIDGDTIRVARHTVRLAGLDAPEEDQVAIHQHGYVFKQGKRVKHSLIRAIGGKRVEVKVEGYDRYERVVGNVMCDGKDVGEWLVLNGYAVAAFGDQYKHIEREARLARRGLWGHAKTHHPAAWRRRP